MEETKGAPEVVVKELELRALELYEQVVKDGKLAMYGASLDDVDFEKVVGIWAR